MSFNIQSMVYIHLLRDQIIGWFWGWLCQAHNAIYLLTNKFCQSYSDLIFIGEDILARVQYCTFGGDASSSTPSGTGLGGFGGPTMMTLILDCLISFPWPGSNSSALTSVTSPPTFSACTRNLSLQSLRDAGYSRCACEQHLTAKALLKIPC